MNRLFDKLDLTRVASSHEGQYSYWIASDRYVYQLRHVDSTWIGWLCSLDVWERTFSKSTWIALEVPLNG